MIFGHVYRYIYRYMPTVFTLPIQQEKKKKGKNVQSEILFLRTAAPVNHCVVALLLCLNMMFD